MKPINIVAVVLVAAALGAGASAQSALATTERTSANTPTESGNPAPSLASANYVIGPEDVLHINVWKEPDLSGNVPVRPDGNISLALLHDVHVAGLTPMQLTDLLTDRLKKYVAQPQVTVIVTSINSRRVYVLGEVGRPGAIPLQSDITVLQALSNAGGFSPFANVRNIYVLRQEGGSSQKHQFDYKEVVKGRKPEQNIVLKPGDTIVVP